MQYANVMVALGGDTRNTVPKYTVSAAEIGVLQAIHGTDAVFDVEYVGKDLALDTAGKPKSNRQIREDLRLIYGGARDGNGNSIFEQLFPGVAARVFENLNELGIPDTFFKATAHAEVPEPEPEEEPEEAPKPAAKPAKGKAAKGKAAKVEAPVEPVEEDDGLDELPADDGDVMG